MMDTITMNAILILGIMAIWISSTDKDGILEFIRKPMYKSDGDTLKSKLLQPLVCGVCGTFWVGIGFVLFNEFIYRKTALDWAILSAVLAYLMANVYFRYISPALTREVILKYKTDGEEPEKENPDVDQ